MKNFITKSGWFLGFFALFFILVNFIYLGAIMKTDFDFRKRLESIRFEEPDFELLVLGASTSYDAFNAELLMEKGVKSYNLALGGSTVRTDLIQLNDYIDSYSRKPRYVLLGLNSSMQDFDNELIHPIVEVTQEDHKFKIEDVPILKFKWLGFEFLKKVVSKNHRKLKIVYGQIRVPWTVPDLTSYADQYLDLGKYESSYWLKELATFCYKNDMELRIIEMPGYRETQNLSEEGPYEITFNNGIIADLYNFNSRKFCELFDANGDWLANSHLNENGANKFTEEVFKILME